MTPVGSLSVFGYKTPVPFPFGTELTGYLFTDLDAAVKAARSCGAELVVDPFTDPIGRDAVIRWPGGVNMQLYWHTTAPNAHALQTVPENRLYVSADRADEFVRDFQRFSHGKVMSDNRQAPGIEIGRPADTYRSILLESVFGKVNVLVTDGHLPYPYGHELTGYEVADLARILEKAQSVGVKVLVPPYSSRGRQASLVEFPGGYIAELHAPSP
jgi:predicted enzyme related to lactoylglutathione lyase